MVLNVLTRGLGNIFSARGEGMHNQSYKYILKLLDGKDNCQFSDYMHHYFTMKKK